MKHTQVHQPRGTGASSLRTAFALLVAFCILGLSAQAQVLYGSLTGNVTDPQGAAVAGAQVEARNVNTGAVQQATTDSSGIYRFVAVQPGTYTITISNQGFAKQVFENVSVVVNAVRRVDAALVLAKANETVTVTAEIPLLQTDKADVHSDLSARQIENLSLSSSQGRNFQSLYKIIPGSGLPTEANSPSGNPQRAISVSTGGQSIQTNSTRIDGAADQYPWLPQNIAYVPPADAIETVNITTNSFDAELGAAGGTAVNVQIKSGTNQFHGSAADYYNDAIFNAKNFFFVPTFTNPVTGVTGPNQKPKNVNNEFSGTIGGPIIKDKLFIFGDYQRTTQRTIATSNQTVFGGSNAALGDFYQNVRSGNFSGLIPPGTDCNNPPAGQNPASGCIFDPATGNPDGTGRTQFPNNTIPADRLDQAAVAFLNRIPIPNVPVTAMNKTGNYFAKLPAAYTRNGFDVKVNYVPSSKATTFGRYSLSQSLISDPPVLSDPAHLTDPNFGAGGGAINGASAGQSSGRVQSVGLGATYSFSPNVLADWNFGFTRQRLNALNFDLAKNVGSDELGILGTNGPDLLQGGIPAFLFSGGYSTMGNSDTGSPFLFRDNQWVTNGNLSWNRGKHALRFGVEMNRAGIKHFQPQGGSFGTARGSFRFTGEMTQRPPINTTTGLQDPTKTASVNLQNALADFLVCREAHILGLPAL